MSNNLHPTKLNPLVQQIGLAFAVMVGGSQLALAADAVPTSTEGVLITGTKAASAAPVKASLKATQPQSEISGVYIEDTMSQAADLIAVARLAPSVSAGIAANGPSLSEGKVSLRGFQDAEYNMTYDGIPFGDTNNPTHHSTSYFPAKLIGNMVVERGPGNASNLGQATFGGSINMFSRELPNDSRTNVYASTGSWNTRLIGTELDTGNLEKFGDANMMFSYQKLKSDGYLTYNKVENDNYQIKAQRQFGNATTVTAFFTNNKIKSYAPDNAGVTLTQVALYGKNYSLNNDPTSQAYWDYNYADKQTDFEYLRVQSSLGDGFALDNNLYSYYYRNSTVSGTDPTGVTANGTKAGPKGNLDVPGYNKINEYRVTGDIFKLTKKLSSGLLRGGVWLELANTNRSTVDLDMTLGVADPKEKTAPATIKYDQKSSWTQYQPFVEFEWAAMPDLTVTPGLKYMNFKRAVDAAVNQTTRLPTQASTRYTKVLPFLTANYAINTESSVYAQYAKGMLVPDLNTFYIPNPTLSKPDPQTSTNYQLGYVYNADRLTWDADVYYIDFNNKIVSVGSGLDQHSENIGGVIYKGLEGQATYYVGNGFSIAANGAINSAKKKSSGLQVAKAPTYTAGYGFLYKAAGLTSSLMTKRVGEQYPKDDEPAAYKIDAFSTTDFNISYTFKHIAPQIKSVKAQLSVNNVFNKQNVISISTNSNALYDQYAFQPKRNFLMSLSADF